MNDLEKLSVHLCPHRRLCECGHPGGRYACPHCACDCPLPTEDERTGNPDACLCCSRDMGLS